MRRRKRKKKKKTKKKEGKRGKKESERQNDNTYLQTLVDWGFCGNESTFSNENPFVLKLFTDASEASGSHNHRRAEAFQALCMKK